MAGRPQRSPANTWLPPPLPCRYARARFAAQNVPLLQPEEKVWAVSAFVGYEWAAMLYQFPMMALAVWHLMLAATAAVAQHGGGGSG